MSEKTTIGRLAFWCGFTGLILILILLLYFIILALPQTQGVARVIAPPAVYPYLKTISIVIGIISGILALAGIFVGLVGLFQKKMRGSLAGFICGLVWLALVVVLIAVIFMMFSAFKQDKKLTPSEYDKYDKCRKNQKQLELIINEFWLSDHPKATPEEIMDLDLSNDGSAVSFTMPNGQVIYYTGDMNIYDCPSDGTEENLLVDDTDYVVDYIDEEGYVHVKCIDPEGIEAGHNEEGLKKEEVEGK